MSMPLINLQFINADDTATSLIGTDFSVKVAIRKVKQEAEPIQTVEKGRFGREKTVTTQPDDKWVNKVYNNSLDIQGGASCYSYHGGGYQESHTANNISFREYSETLTKAIESQASRPIIVVDLAEVQKANLAKKTNG